MGPAAETLRFVELALRDGCCREEAPDDARFRCLTASGNEAFERRDDDAACRFYGEALAEAERLFSLALDGGSPVLAPMAHNIACHNMAEAKRRPGDDAGALALEIRAVERLVVTATSAANPLGLRVNCARHLRHALFFLTEDPPSSGTDATIVRDLVAHAGRVAADVMSITRHALAAEGFLEPAALDAGCGAWRQAAS